MAVTIAAFLVGGICGSLLFGMDPFVAGALAMVAVTLIGTAIMAKADRKAAITYVGQIAAVILAAFVTARVKVLNHAFTSAVRAVPPVVVVVVWAVVAGWICIHQVNKRFGSSKKNKSGS
jgi:hypothetical protein